MDTKQEDGNLPKEVVIDIAHSSKQVGKTYIAALLTQKLREEFPDIKIYTVNSSGDQADQEVYSKDFPDIESIIVDAHGHERINVTGEAVRELLRNLEAPPNHIRELQLTRFHPGRDQSNPINILKADIDRHDARKKKFKR